MAVKIRLKRLGKIHAPHYRVVVMDSRTRRDGRAIEEIGLYNPMQEPSLIQIDSERVQYWLGVGAQPTEQVAALLKVTGDWQQFKGIDGAEGTLRTKDASEETVAAARAEAVKAAEDAAEKRKSDASAKKAEEEAAAAAEASADESTDSDDAAAEGSTETAEGGAEAPAEEA
ncbi:30S ribosomal protein S16 [Georgenia sp. Z1344]|uniref:30S ribosomal protein S16 n=1 Tax=Georgenia sp. Z1344 TaxID=3416706 RepID=UPI003CF99494